MGSFPRDAIADLPCPSRPYAHKAHKPTGLRKQQAVKQLLIHLSQMRFFPGESSVQGRQNDRIGLDLGTDAPQPKRLESDRGELRQEARTQQLRLEDAHAAAVLGVAILKEVPEIESVEEHADLGRSKVLPVVH